MKLTLFFKLYIKNKYTIEKVTYYIPEKWKKQKIANPELYIKYLGLTSCGFWSIHDITNDKSSKTFTFTIFLMSFLAINYCNTNVFLHSKLE